MQRAGDELFPCPALAVDQDRDVARREPVHLTKEPPHRGAATVQLTVAVGFGFAFELRVAQEQPAVRDGVLDDGLELRPVEWLRQVVVRAPLHGGHDALNGTGGRQHDNRHQRMRGFFQAARAESAGQRAARWPTG